MQISLSEKVRIAFPVADLNALLSKHAEDLLPFIRISSHEGDSVAEGPQSTFEEAVTSAGLVPSAQIRMLAVLIGRTRHGHQDGPSIRLPIRWETSGYRVLFNEFHGFFVTHSATSKESTLGLEGTYDVPIPLRGDEAMDSLCRRAARRACRNLLENLKVAVEEVLSEKALR